MNSTLATQERPATQVARPLKVLVPLIKEDLKQGEEAAKAAGMEYYRAAGKKMIEAKASDEIKQGGFGAWIKKNFQISQAQAQVYMGLANPTNAGTLFSSLSDFKRSLGHTVTPGSQRNKDWRKPVKETIDAAKEQAARIHEANLSAKRQHDEMIKLCLHMVDLGYKILSKELHPDKKGGSSEAMSRLNAARKYAKAALL